MAGRNVGSRNSRDDAARAASVQDGGPPQGNALVDGAMGTLTLGAGVGPRAVVYVRISDDPSGLERGVDRQEADCRALASGLGLEVAAVFRENDTSAFKQRTLTLPSGERVRRVVRPRFRAMLALLADGGAGCPSAGFGGEMARRRCAVRIQLGGRPPGGGPGPGGVGAGGGPPPPRA
jgi:hypothetical protein